MTTTTARIHRLLNRLLLIGAASQFYTVGLAIWGVNARLHAFVGWSLLPLGLLATVVAAMSRTPGRLGKSLLLMGLLILQPTLVYGVARLSRSLAALHPVNALAVVAVAVWIEITCGPSLTRLGRQAHR